VNAVRRSRAALVWAFVLLLAFGITVGGEDADPIILFFHETDCPDCEQISGLLDGLLIGSPETTMRAYEISEPGVLELFASLCKEYGVDEATVPVVFVGDEVVVGAGRAAEATISDTLTDCIRSGSCSSPLLRIEAGPFPWTDVLWLSAVAALFAFLMAWQLR